MILRLADLPSALRAAAALTMAAVALAAGGGRAEPGRDPAAAQDRAPWDLTLFHTNDAHGAFLPAPAAWRDDRAPVGGVVALGACLARERRAAPVSLLLDAGDFMTGNPICDIEVDGARGGGWQDLLGLLGYDAGVIGNHEFDHGRANALALAARSLFPLLADDILDERGEPLLRPGPLVIERAGLRIGIIGVSCAGLFAVTSPARTGGLSLRDQERVVREQLARLIETTDVQLLISHSGFDDDKRLAARLAGSGLDVIIGGHSHTRLTKPAVAGADIPIVVQAGSHLRQLGRLDLRIEAGRVVGHQWRAIELLAAGATDDAPDTLVAAAAHWEERIRQEFGRVIATLASDWRDSGRQESNVGSWIADALRARARADVAFVNSGSIRRDQPAGPLTALDVKEILPFENTLVTFELTGEQLRRIALNNARLAAHRGGILQISGLTYAWREVGDHVEVEDVRVAGEPARDGRVYRAAAPDYVCLQAKDYLAMDPPTTRYAGVTVTDAVLEAAAAAGTIDARVEGRMRQRVAQGR